MESHTGCLVFFRPRSVDFTDGGFFSSLSSAVGRSKIKIK